MSEIQKIELIMFWLDCWITKILYDLILECLDFLFFWIFWNLEYSKKGGTVVGSGLEFSDFQNSKKNLCIVENAKFRFWRISASLGLQTLLDMCL